ncbi:MAG: hypothetical protein AMXMBFR4_22170 [Candidatus Hydrogenedentota bacterium]
MQLLDGERTFLERRRRFARSWRYVGVSLLLLVAGMGCWLYFYHPLLANPVFVARELRRGGIEQKTLELMAAILPIAIIVIVVLCGVFVLLAFAAFSNEVKYLAIISRETQNVGKSPNDSLQARRP